jgi:hypothetical protein
VSKCVGFYLDGQPYKGTRCLGTMRQIHRIKMATFGAKPADMTFLDAEQNGAHWNVFLQDYEVILSAYQVRIFGHEDD